VQLVAATAAVLMVVIAGRMKDTLKYGFQIGSLVIAGVLVSIRLWGLIR
jgi:hypothetical protein